MTWSELLNFMNLKNAQDSGTAEAKFQLNRELTLANIKEQQLEDLSALYYDKENKNIITPINDILRMPKNLIGKTFESANKTFAEQWTNFVRDANALQFGTKYDTVSTKMSDKFNSQLIKTRETLNAIASSVEKNNSVSAQLLSNLIMQLIILILQWNGQTDYILPKELFQKKLELNLLMI